MRGFSIIELLVVISIFALIVGFAVVGFQNYARYQEFEYSATETAALIEQARVDSRSAIGNVSHGVFIQPSSITVFAGNVYDSMDVTNQITTFNNVRFEHSLSDAGDVVIFSQLKGLPSATGTISIIDDSLPATTTLSVTLSGIVQ